MTVDQLTCRCGDVFSALVDLLNHCRLMHPDADVDPVAPEVVDLTAHVCGPGCPSFDMPVVVPQQWADEVLAALARGLDLPPGLTLAWDTTPLIRREERPPPPVQ